MYYTTIDPAAPPPHLASLLASLFASEEFYTNIYTDTAKVFSLYFYRLQDALKHEIGFMRVTSLETCE